MKTLMFVDDEESIRLLYREEFEEKGFNVVLSENGEEALEIFDDVRPDLVIIDIKMPGMDGIEFLKRLREKSRDVPAILCTAYGEYKQNFETWASDAYIVKSSRLEGLFEKVDELLSRKERQ